MALNPSNSWKVENSMKQADPCLAPCRIIQQKEVAYFLVLLMVGTVY